MSDYTMKDLMESSDVVILQDTVIIGSGSVNKYYKDKGYIKQGVGQSGWFNVDLVDVNPKSSIMVKVSCPICDNEREQRIENIIRRCSTKCNPCSINMMIGGERFGNLTIVSHAYGRYYNCMCDCGKPVVCSSNLKDGKTASCGCLKYTQNGKNGRNLGVKQLALDTLGYYCDTCKSPDMLNVHHLNSDDRYKYSSYEEELEEVVILCHYCHTNFHSSMGSTHVVCTEQDYINWKETQR